MPPPRSDDIFPETVLLVSVNVPSFSIKPTLVPPVLLFMKLRSNMVTATPGRTRTILPLLPPLIARDCAPGPRMIMFLVKVRSLLVRKITLFLKEEVSNVIVLPALAVIIAQRRDPTPSSLDVVTLVGSTGGCSTDGCNRNQLANPVVERSSNTTTTTLSVDRTRRRVLAWRNVTSRLFGTLRLTHALASLS